MKLHKDGKPGTAYPYTDFRDVMQWRCVLSCVQFKMRGYRY